MPANAPVPFANRVRALAKEKNLSLSRLGNLAWDHQVEGTSPDTLKKAVDRRDPRRPPLALIEAVAAVLDVDPREFVEYELAAARRLFDERAIPLDRAAENLRALRTAMEDRLIEAEREAQQLVTGASPTERTDGRSRRQRPSRQTPRA